ncbi:MAG: hypothetical protein WCD54_16970, partial [Pseudolabrys sp.]
YSATQPEVESLAQVKSRVLDSLQYLIKSGVLIASDFTTFAPASVRQALAKADLRPAMRLERLRLGDF